MRAKNLEEGGTGYKKSFIEPPVQTQIFGAEHLSIFSVQILYSPPPPQGRVIGDPFFSNLPPSLWWGAAILYYRNPQMKIFSADVKNFLPKIFDLTSVLISGGTSVSWGEEFTVAFLVC